MDNNELIGAKVVTTSAFVAQMKERFKTTFKKGTLDHLVPGLNGSVMKVVDFEGEQMYLLSFPDLSIHCTQQQFEMLIKESLSV